MLNRKSEKELQEMYEAIGVDNSKFTESGEMNVLISTWPSYSNDEDPDAQYHIAPVIYMPRQETSYQTDEFDLKDEEQKKEYLALCENAIERYKVWQYLLQKHIDEIKTQGYPVTSSYYPELDEYEIKK